jgi:hypothetical protein
LIAVPFFFLFSTRERGTANMEYSSLLLHVLMTLILPVLLILASTVLYKLLHGVLIYYSGGKRGWGENIYTNQIFNVLIPHCVSKQPLRRSTFMLAAIIQLAILMGTYALAVFCSSGLIFAIALVNTCACSCHILQFILLLGYGKNEKQYAFLCSTTRFGFARITQNS